MRESFVLNGRDLSSFPIFFGKAKGGAAREGAASLRF